MTVKVSEKALRILRGARENSGSGADSAQGHAIEQQRREVVERTNPDAVAPSTLKFWTPEAHARRVARREALEARLALFRDNVDSIRTANRVMNNAAIIHVMSAAEKFITQIRAISEVEKQAILYSAQTDLLSTLRAALVELETLRAEGGLPDQVLDQRTENSINEYAERSVKIAGLDFEFEKTSLLKLRELPLRNMDGAE